MVDAVESLLAGEGWAPFALIAIGVVLVGVLGALRRRVRRPRPRPGEVWFAEVPFEDGSGSKDRPVLVLDAAGRTCTVAAFTSQDRSTRTDHVRLPAGVPGVRRASWVRSRPTTLRASALRRRVGEPGEALVQWYERATASRAPHRSDR
ncbi:type II toxin-antitoxin system PemK/MazF family toxin [Cellulomonas chengniuliangii]|uniref:type II toxin-antitoxin system PemK/MazF family toxin n=1 Tax=Cellulomonas chengniuliangii TaxID=2968084 RepID=UPI001D0E796D|nr:type II toxin-antitoxin system PemK/MazF family toxin [Cellulomonas chengniuliangii]MCC2319080.1 type II toxin-antitoxin system PemK/MazF family toxin [Cellulomonas chengniuliangii]